MTQERVGFGLSSFESNPSVKAKKSVVKPLFENDKDIPFAWGSTE